MRDSTSTTVLILVFVVILLALGFLAWVGYDHWGPLPE